MDRRLLSTLVRAATFCVCAWAAARGAADSGRVAAPDTDLEPPDRGALADTAADARALVLYANDPAEPSSDAAIFDERDEESGVRITALVSPATQPSPSEFDLRIGVWSESGGPRFANAPTLHLIALDSFVEVRSVWRVNAYSHLWGEATVLPSPAAGDVYAAGGPPQRFGPAAGPLRTTGEPRFVAGDSDAGRGDYLFGSDLGFALEWKNHYDTYTIPGADGYPAAGYEYVIPLRAKNGLLTSRVVVTGIDWEAAEGATRSSSDDTAVAIEFDHDEGAAARERRANFEPLPSDIAHTGVIVRISSDNVGRKPYLRVDAIMRYSPEAMQANPALMERLRGGEGKAFTVRGLLRDIPLAEEIEADQLLIMERASEAIRKVLIEEGFPPPTLVLFSSWVIQG